MGLPSGICRKKSSAPWGEGRDAVLIERVKGDKCLKSVLKGLFLVGNPEQGFHTLGTPAICWDQFLLRGLTAFQDV